MMAGRWIKRKIRIGKALPLAAVVLIVLAMLAACGSDITVSKSTKKKAPEARSAQETVAAVAPAAKVEKDYVYTSIGKRDPFRSIFDETGGEATMDAVETILSPLQNYDITSFTVTAILWGIPSPSAMVVAPDSKTYTVKQGTLIGRNWGRVVKIKRDGIVVLEQTRMPNGQKITNTITLKLPVKTISAKGVEFGGGLNLDEALEETQDSIIEDLSGSRGR